MGRLTALVLLGTALSFPSAAALAADGWTGFTVGVQGGVVNLSGTEDYDPRWAAPSDPYNTWDAGTGLSIGLFAGYDFEVSESFVLGVGGEVNWVDASAVEWPEPVFTGYEDEVTNTWDASIYLRAGVLVTPEVLVYGLLGYGWGGFDMPYWDDGNPDYTSDYASGGVKVGVGVEAVVAEGMVARGEISTILYDDFDIELLDSPFWVVSPQTVSVKGGLGWKF